jgi:hypothetical protein
MLPVLGHGHNGVCPAAPDSGDLDSAPPETDVRPGLAEVDGKPESADWGGEPVSVGVVMLNARRRHGAP